MEALMHYVLISSSSDDSELWTSVFTKENNCTNHFTAFQDNKIVCKDFNWSEEHYNKRYI